MCPHVVLSRFVPGLFALGSVLLPPDDDVLTRSLAMLVLVASDGTELAIYLDGDRWELRVTPELREQARVLMLEQQRRIIGESRATEAA